MKHRMVLNGTFKMTPRRSEVLYHLACLDNVVWRAGRNFTSKLWRGESMVIFVPYLGETNIASFMSLFKKHRLITYSRESKLPHECSGWRDNQFPILLPTLKGMRALLEYVADS
jgi:hypothetical protein